MPTDHRVDTYTIERREVLGKRVKRLRREGLLPANIFGRGVPSLAVQLPTREARAMLVAHGRDSLIQVQVAGEPRPRPVVVRAVQQHPATGNLEHVDFYQVDLSRPITATVPVTIVGEAPAVRDHGGILLHGQDSVHVEALPADVPEHLEVSVARLTEIDQQVTVADLVLPAGVTALSDPDTMLARVSRPRQAEEGAAVLEGEQALAAQAGAEAVEDAAEQEAGAEATD